MAAEIVAQLCGGAAEREAAYAHLLQLEAEHFNANAALDDGTADLIAQHTVTEKVDETQQATQSVGAMGEGMHEHGTARAAAVRESSRSLADIAVACASPLCEVLCKTASEVDVAEWHRASQVLAALSGLDPARVAGECYKTDQCNTFKVWTAPDSALGVGEKH